MLLERELWTLCSPSFCLIQLSCGFSQNGDCTASWNNMFKGHMMPLHGFSQPPNLNLPTAVPGFAIFSATTQKILVPLLLFFSSSHCRLLLRSPYSLLFTRRNQPSYLNLWCAVGPSLSWQPMSDSSSFFTAFFELGRRESTGCMIPCLILSVSSKDWWEQQLCLCCSFCVNHCVVYFTLSFASVIHGSDSLPKAPKFSLAGLQFNQLPPDTIAGFILPEL